MQLKADISEEGLSLRCKQEDMNARRMLYERYGGALMAICLRYTGNREEAEDVLHDGFLHIFESIKQFTYQGEGSLKAWLSRVMVNEALGFLRKRNLQTQQEMLLNDIPDVPDEEDNGCHKEIASILGITEHTSSSQFYRAKSLLMKKINEYRNKELTR